MTKSLTISEMAVMNPLQPIGHWTERLEDSKVIPTSPEGKKYEVRTRTHYVASRNLSERSREGGNK